MEYSQILAESQVERVVILSGPGRRERADHRPKRHTVGHPNSKVVTPKICLTVLNGIEQVRTMPSHFLFSGNQTRRLWV